MKKILLIVFVLIVGMAFGQVGQDLIILKNGNRSNGDYIETLGDSLIVFKPTQVNDELKPSPLRQSDYPAQLGLTGYTRVFRT